MVIVLEEVDLEDLEVADSVEEMADEMDSEAEILEDPLKCMKLPAINAENNVKFHLNQPETNRFFAVIVLEKIQVREMILIQEIRIELNQEFLQNN